MVSNAMVPEEKIADFVNRLRTAAGANLESVILFGSAVAGDFHPEFSNINLFCVLRDSSFAALQALAPAVKWWEKQNQPPPLFMTHDEIKRSTDVFTIELLDMQQHHRVLFGEDVVQKLSISATCIARRWNMSSGKNLRCCASIWFWRRVTTRGCGMCCCDPFRRLLLFFVTH